MPLIAAVFDKYFVPLRPHIKNKLWQMKDMMDTDETVVNDSFSFKEFSNAISLLLNNNESFSINRKRKNFIWVNSKCFEATDEYHYEFCADNTKNANHDGKHVFVEVHFESPNHSFFKNALTNINGLASFKWSNFGVRINDNGLEMKGDVSDVANKALNELYDLDLLVGKTITQIISKLKMNTERKNILQIKKNIILQGAPGTGKTYNTAALALSICGVKDGDKFMVREDGKDSEYVMKFSDHSIVMKKYEELQKEGRIGFCTFHQSMDYEDFVEGIKPKTTNGQITYEVEPGIFKTMCKNAINKDSQNYVLIIDEINRGNVSKIFGELITLLEADKRIGVTEEEKKTLHTIWLTLPYSKKPFGVPSNLYIIGTMNTTDRSVGNIDYAVRRRFAFVTLKAERELVEQNSIPTAVELFKSVELFLQKHRIDMDFDDLMVGHSYFFAKDENELTLKWKYEILPLLNEYIKDNIVNAKTISSDTSSIAGFVNTYKPESQSDTIENNE